MQVHYYKTTWGRAWQKYNQKKHGYNPMFKDVKPLNKKRRHHKPTINKTEGGLLTKEILAQRRERWEQRNVSEQE